MVPNERIKGEENVENETVSVYVNRLKDVWDKTRRNLKMSVSQRKEFYYRRYRAAYYVVGSYIILLTMNLGGQNVPTELQQQFLYALKLQSVFVN